MDGRDSSNHERLAAGLLLVLTLAVIGLSIDRVRLEARSQEECLASSTQEVTLDRPFRPVEFTTDLGEGVLYTGHSGNFIDFQVLMYGAYEKPMLHFVRDTLEGWAARDGVFLDVGANTGQHSLFMSSFAAEVHAFEPYEPVLARFRAMIESNGIENIVVHPVGLGREPARVPFHEPHETNMGTGSFVDGFRGHDAAVSVLEIVVGDDALAAAGVQRVHVAKVDVEGFEKPVLEGLRATLERSRPVIVLELSIDPASDDLFASEAELLEALPADYACRALQSDGADLWTGSYRLAPCQLDFTRKHQRSLVWYPREREASVPGVGVYARTRATGESWGAGAGTVPRTASSLP